MFGLTILTTHYIYVDDFQPELEGVDLPMPTTAGMENNVQSASILSILRRSYPLNPPSSWTDPPVDRPSTDEVPRANRICGCDRQGR